MDRYDRMDRQQLDRELRAPLTTTDQIVGYIRSVVLSDSDVRRVLRRRDELFSGHPVTGPAYLASMAARQCRLRYLPPSVPRIVGY